MNIKKIVLGVSLLCGVISNAFSADVFEVSTKKGEYNEILLTQPFVDVLFNDKNAVEGKVVVLNNNKNLLFKLKSTVKKDLQLFIVLRDGTRKKIKIIPNSKIDGQTWPNDAAGSLGPEKVSFKEEGTPKEKYISLLKELYEAKEDADGNRPAPSGFSEVKANDVAYYGPVLIREIKRFSNSLERISVYALSSNRPVPVTPADFYRKDVVAIELNVDEVTPEESIMVVISREKGV